MDKASSIKRDQTSSYDDNNWIVLVGGSATPDGHRRMCKVQICGRTFQIPLPSCELPAQVVEGWQEVQEFIFTGYPVYFPLKKKLRIAYEHTVIGAWWDVVIVILSLLVFGFFIRVVGNHKVVENPVLNMVDLVCLGFFGLDFLFRWFIYGEYKTFYLSLNALTETWVDVITFLPVLIGRADLSVNFAFVRIARILRLLRRGGILEKWMAHWNTLSRTLTIMLITLFVSIIIAAGFVQYIEEVTFADSLDCNYVNEATNWEPSCYSNLPTYGNDTACDCNAYPCFAVRRARLDPHPVMVRCSSMTFFTALWFMIVTASTVGYGDNFPRTFYGRMIVIVFIIWFLFYTTMLVNEYNDLMGGNARYLTFQDAKQGCAYVIIVGELRDQAALTRVLNELFISSREASHNIRVVLLGPLQPSNEILDVIYRNHFRGKVSYVMGSCLTAEDLARIQAHKADAVFILSDSQTLDTEKEDMRGIITTIAIENCNADIKTYSQVLERKNKSLVKDDADFVICFQELRSGMLATNALVPGAACLISNLFSSFDSHLMITGSASRKPWMKEYLRGMQNEVHFVRITSNKVWEALRKDIHPFVIWLFIRYSVIMIGIASSGDARLILLNPETLPAQNGDIQDYDTLILICPHEKQATEVEKHLNENNRKLLIKSLVSLSASNSASRSSKPRARVGTGSSARERLDSAQQEVYSGKSAMKPKSASSLPATGVSTTRTFPREPYVPGFWKGHIVVIGDFPSGKLLLSHLRKPHYRGTGLWKPVLYVVEEISEDDELEVQAFENVAIVEAKPAEYMQYIEGAFSCLILKSSDVDEEFADFELGLDAKVIMRFLRMSNVLALSSSYISMELLNQDSVGVLNSTLIRREEVSNLDAEVARRKSMLSEPRSVASTSMQASLMRNTNDWNHPSIDEDKFKHTIGRSDASMRSDAYKKAEEKSRDPDEQGYNKKPLYASGTCYLPFLKDRLIVQAFWAPQIALVCDALLRAHLPNAKLFQCAIPDEFFKPEEYEGTSFTWIFSCFLKKRMCLAIALYRARTAANQASISYVYTCPDPMTRVTRADKIFLLGSREELISLVGKETPLPKPTESS